MSSLILIETGLSPINNIAMTRYLIYKHTISYMKNKRIPMIASNSSQSHPRFSQACNKDTKYSLNDCGIEKDVTLQNVDNIKNAFTSKFKEKL